MSHSISTHAGHEVDLLNPTPDMIDPRDIALALSRICRFGGHTLSHYSVAQHCWLASQLVPVEHQLAALLHDATEAYVGDVVSPLKALLPDYRQIEHRLWLAIAERFDLDSQLPSCVHNIDLILLATERRDLVVEQTITWTCLQGVGRLPMTIEPWTMQAAERAWLTRFNELHDLRAAGPERMAS